MGKDHGGMSFSLSETLKRHGLHPKQAIDFSVNLNTYGPSSTVLNALLNCDFKSYPDPEGEELAKIYGDYLDLDYQQIIFGNGACDLLWGLARVFAAKPHRTLILEPTFCEWQAAAESAGLSIKRELLTDKDFKFDREKIENHLKNNKYDSIYLCNPNSPTSTYLPHESINRISLNYPNTFFILDESFLSLSIAYEAANFILPSNVIRLRSLTKDHAIAGVRLGYAIAPQEIVELIRTQRPAWQVNSFALAVGSAVIRDEKFIQESRIKLLRDTQYLKEQVQALGFEVTPNSTIFIFAKIPEQVESSSKLREKLLPRGILVRSCQSYGFDQWVRLAGRQKHDVDQLCHALKEVLK